MEDMLTKTIALFPIEFFPAFITERSHKHTINDLSLILPQSQVVHCRICLISVATPRPDCDRNSFFMASSRSELRSETMAGIREKSIRPSSTAPQHWSNFTGFQINNSVLDTPTSSASLYVIPSSSTSLSSRSRIELLWTWSLCSPFSSCSPVIAPGLRFDFKSRRNILASCYTCIPPQRCLRNAKRERWKRH